MPCLLASPLMQQALAMADPSEPKYCHCQRISFGEMIACENPGAPGWLLQGCQQAGQQPAEGSTARLPASQLAMPLTARPAACLQTAHTSGSAVQMCLPHNPLIFLGLAAAGKWYCRDCKKQLQKK